ncbi:DUF4214 domain-containing protein [Caulobacter sp. 602-2]|uniref:DUF4214 domain-containing protein n=1 Tax=Caulobacter sp. 602-2 TaxID=2710887 RepID=A0A6G4QZ87_9CAUL|nr:DUF4214 domain-containing protein [Caulobacter sp. 602-2]
MSIPSEQHHRDVDLSALMAQLKRAARVPAGRRFNEAQVADQAPPPPPAAAPAPVHVAAPVDPELYYFMANRRFRVQDFLGVEQHKFVAAIYAGLLRREPDPGGAAYYSSGALASRYHRLGVIIAVRFSDEGRARNVQIENLLFWRLVLKFMRPVEYRRALIRMLK